MEKNLIIVRGLAGSGKSTFANLLEGYICTADDYHMKDGKYEWKLENNARAHFECQHKCENLMKLSVYKIVIANTLSTEREMKPYYDMAQKYGYKVFSVIVENRHNGVNVHNVPSEAIQKMKERFSIKLI